MRQLSFKCSTIHLFTAFLLTLVIVPLQAQYYQMNIRTYDGLIIPYDVNLIESVYFELKDTIAVVNDEDETTVTGNASDITNYTATITSWANILDNLSSDLKIGVIYTSKGTPNKNNGTQKIINLSDLGSDAKYSVFIDDLSPSTIYYYRAFVYQSGIWFYGDIKSFTTKSQGQGINIFSGNVSKVTCYSAKISGAVKIEETIQFTELAYGVCYSTDSVPNFNVSNTNNNLKYVYATSRDSEGNYTCQLSALEGSTEYFYRSFACIDGHYNYGPILSFGTKEDDVVVTGKIDTTTFMVQSALEIGSGAYSKLELGVCYGTNIMPTINDQKLTTNEVDENNNYSLLLNKVPFDTLYYRSFVLIDDVVHYGSIVKTVGNKVLTGGIDSVSLSVESSILCSRGYSKVKYGVCYGFSEVPTTSNQRITQDQINNKEIYKLTLDNIPFGVVYYRAYIVVDGFTYYGKIKKFIGKALPDLNGLSYVDMGLSVLWATCNVGASEPIEKGNYYAWGETETKDYYYYTTYKWWDKDDRSYIKYFNENLNDIRGSVDNKSILELEDDAARAVCGGDWRIPTYEEIKELQNNCTWEQTIQSGVVGYNVTSTKAGYTNQSIFLPMAQYKDEGRIVEGLYGHYWSSTLDTTNPSQAFELRLQNNGRIGGSMERYKGLTIRPVCK